MKLVEAVVETDEAIMERYLADEEISGDELAAALKNAVVAGQLFPVTCGVPTKNLGTTGLLDLLVEGIPSPAKKPMAVDVDGGGPAAFVFKTVADPFAGRINLFRVLSGTLSSDSTLVNSRTKNKERVGQLLILQGKDHEQAHEFGEGDIGAVAKLKETATGDVLLGADKPVDIAPLVFPKPVMSFAIEPKAKGDEEKMGTALKRLAEEDPTLTLRRDEQTGEQLLGGLSQIHVEVAVDRLKRRFGVEVDLHQPRVPYLETIRKESRAQGRYKKQTGGRGQFGDCHIVLEPLPGHEGYEFVDKIVGGVIPQGFRPAVDKGIQETMARGELAGAPVTGVRVLLVDGSYHNVDSSEMAFKIAGSMAFKSAYEKANPVLLEPIMSLEAAVPDDSVGAINGDLNSRRGRLLGMEPAGAGMTTIKAEVPMGEVLTYSQSLTSLTGGRGDYTLAFLRYEEVPSHIAQKLVEEAKREREEAKCSDASSADRTSSAPARSAIAPCSWASGPCASRPAATTGSTSARSAPSTADEHGWIKEGSPTTPIVSETRRRRRFGGLAALLEPKKVEPEQKVSEPMLRRLNPEEQAVVEAAELFNDSAYRRTIAGIAKSLGDARVSLLPLSGVNPEVVITVAWDISWYQYRVVFESGQPVRLAERGYELEDLNPRFARWNGHLGPDGRVTPDIPKL